MFLHGPHDEFGMPQDYYRYLVLYFATQGIAGVAHVIELTDPLKLSLVRNHTSDQSAEAALQKALDHLRNLHSDKPYEVRINDA